MKSQHLEIKINEKSCDSFVAYPSDEGKFPAVVLFMDAFGPRPYLEQMAMTLAEQGYFVLVPNMFYRIKKAPILDVQYPLKPEDMPEARKAMMSIYSAFDPNLAMKDIEVLLQFLQSQKQTRLGKIGVTGYCMGGALALRTAAAFPDQIAAAASFHAGNLASQAENSPHLGLGKIKAEIYVAHADHDGSMPAEQIERFRLAAEQCPAKCEVELYKDAAHGFAMADLPSFNEAALQRHWTKLLALFNRTLKN